MALRSGEARPRPANPRDPAKQKAMLLRVMSKERAAVSRIRFVQYALLGIAILGSLAWFFVWSPRARVMRNMSQARGFIKELRERTADRSEFDAIHFSVSTAEGGKSILAIGTISSDASFVDLQAIVDTVIPSEYSIRYTLKCRTSDSTIGTYRKRT